MSVPITGVAASGTGTAAGTPAGTDQQQQGGAPPANNGGQQQAPITFTADQQAEINRIMARERDQARRSGKTEAEQAADQARKDAEAKALADQQQFKPLYETAAAERDALKVKYRSSAIRQAVKAQAAAMQFHNPDLAMNLIDPASAEVDDDFNVKNVEALLTPIIAANPYLVKPAPAAGGQQHGGGTGGQQQQQGGNAPRPIPGTPNANPAATPAAGQPGGDREAIDREKARLRGTGRYR